MAYLSLPASTYNIWKMLKQNHGCPLLIQIIASLFPGSGIAASASAADNILLNLHKFFTSCRQLPHSLLLLTTGFS